MEAFAARHRLGRAHQMKVIGPAVGRNDQIGREVVGLRFKDDVRRPERAGGEVFWINQSLESPVAKSEMTSPVSSAMSQTRSGAQTMRRPFSSLKT